MDTQNGKQKLTQPTSDLSQPRKESGLKIFMDKEMVEIEIGGLDLLGMEDACTWKEFNSIPPTQIQLLKEALAKEKSQNNIGVYNPPKKDKQKLQNDNKKSGHK